MDSSAAPKRRNARFKGEAIKLDSGYLLTCPQNQTNISSKKKKTKPQDKGKDKGKDKDTAKEKGGLRGKYRAWASPRPHVKTNSKTGPSGHNMRLTRSIYKKGNPKIIMSVGSKALDPPLHQQKIYLYYMYYVHIVLQTKTSSYNLHFLIIIL